MNNILSDPAAFMGELDPEFIERALSEFYGKIREIKNCLGPGGHLIDIYILMVFSAMDVTTHEDARQEGRCDCMRRLRSLCRSILAGKGNKTHPMYWRARTFMEKHRLPGKRKMDRLDIYAGALMPSFGAYALEEYYNTYYNKLKKDQITGINEMYKAICTRLETEEPMQQLNEIIKKYFLRVSVMAAYLQGFSEDLLMTLASYSKDLGQYTLSAVMDIREN